jgi:hypothetical protein
MMSKIKDFYNFFFIQLNEFGGSYKNDYVCI